MLVDLLHDATDEVPQRPPCGAVALTVNLPPQAWGMEITPERVLWPEAESGGMVVCGSCGGYAGEVLASEFARPHTCVPVQRPDGRWVCRAGCDGGR